jgi:hypothetical protein
MGATQSIISTEDFKNYLYGTTVLMLAPRLDTELKFKQCVNITDEDQHVLPMVLEQGQPKDIDSIVKAYCQYYGNGGKEDAIDKYVQEHILDSEEHIQAFMKQMVGLLQEHRTQVEASIRRLAPQSHVAATHHSQPIPNTQWMMDGSLPQAQAVAPAQSRQQQPAPPEPAQSTHTTPSTHRIRGHGRLQRRTHDVNQAINAEHALYSMQQQQLQVQHAPTPAPSELVAATSQNIALAYQPPEPENIHDLQEYVTGDVNVVYDEASTVEEVAATGVQGEQ